MGYVMSTVPLQSQNVQMALLFKFNIIENRGGGDCLFRSIAVYTTEDENKHASVRTEVCNFIGLNWKTYMRDIITQHKGEVRYFSKIQSRMEELSSDEIETARKAYLDFMKRTGTYGTITELIGAAKLFKFNFSVIQEQNWEKVTVSHYPMKMSYSWAYFLFTGHYISGHWRVVTPTPDKYIYLPPSSTYQRQKSNSKQYVIKWNGPRENDYVHVQRTHQENRDSTGAGVKRRKICLVDIIENPLLKEFGFESKKDFENYSYQNIKHGIFVAQLEKPGEMILKLNPGIQTPEQISKSNITLTILSGNLLFRGPLANKRMSYRCDVSVKKDDVYCLENLSTSQTVYVYCQIEQ